MVFLCSTHGTLTHHLRGLCPPTGAKDSLPQTAAPKGTSWGSMFPSFTFLPPWVSSKSFSPINVITKTEKSFVCTFLSSPIQLCLAHKNGYKEFLVQGMCGLCYNFSVWENEAGRLGILEQSGLHNESLSKK